MAKSRSPHDFGRLPGEPMGSIDPAMGDSPGSSEGALSGEPKGFMKMPATQIPSVPVKGHSRKPPQRGPKPKGPGSY